MPHIWSASKTKKIRSPNVVCMKLTRFFTDRRYNWLTRFHKEKKPDPDLYLEAGLAEVETFQSFDANTVQSWDMTIEV